jgi:GNAT superfamily N-acetyltransferase
MDSRVSIRQTRDYDLMERLYRKAFQGEEPGTFIQDTCWVARNERNRPVGFCTAKLLSREPDVAYLTSAASFSAGIGLQRKLINARCAWAKRKGCNWAISYVERHNYKSLANLIRCGFHLYDPENAYVGRKNYLYLRKRL